MAKDALEQARDLLKQKEFGKAERRLLEIRARDYDDPVVNFLLGQLPPAREATQHA